MLKGLKVLKIYKFLKKAADVSRGYVQDEKQIYYSKYNHKMNKPL